MGVSLWIIHPITQNARYERALHQGKPLQQSQAIVQFILPFSSYDLVDTMIFKVYVAY